MADSILQPNGAANLDPVGAGDVQSAGTSVDPTVVDAVSGDAGAVFVVGDPGLAASTDRGASGAPANPLPPVRSSGGVGDTNDSAVPASASVAGAGVADSAGGDAIAILGFDGIAPAGGVAESGVAVTGGGSAVQFSGPVAADSIAPGSADTPLLGIGPIAPAGAAAASGDPVTAGGLASGAVEGVVAGGGSTGGAPSGSASATTGATSGPTDFGTGFDAVTSVVVSGSGGLTFDISFDSSVSGAPTGFDADVEAAFQYYADTFKPSGSTSAVTLYFNVGYGEVDGSAVTGGFLGESFTFFGTQQTYSTLSSTMSADATTAADKAVVANDLPATDPTGGKTLDMARAQEKALGLVSGTSGSFANPDGDIGFSNTASFDYTSGQTPTSGTYDFLGVVEHEISEVMGRSSWLDLNGTSDYSAMDLFRFSSSGTHQFTTGDPSYFSLDGGKTDLYNWNNFTTGNSGDLGDWAGTTPYTPDSFNDNSDSGVLNPITSRDTTLMDVIGWDRTNSTTYTVSSGQTSSGIIIYSGDQELVKSGGTATVTYALSGGLEVVSSGGSDTGATFGSGAEQDVFGSASTVVLDGGLQVVETGGIATSTTISSGGSQTVLSGGLAANVTTINSSGNETVLAGGTASATTINDGGSLTVSSGGSASFDTINSGGSVLAGGTASATTINSGGSLTVSGMFATAIATTINNGGSETVSGGSAFDDTINSGGNEIVLSAGFADLTTINSGGGETVSSGGSASLDTINSGGLLTVSSGGSAGNDTINSGGLLMVSSGGRASFDTINRGGSLTVSSGGTASTTTINSGGSETVSSGGSATSATIGGTAFVTTINGGLMTVLSGGTATGTTVNSAGSQIVSAGGSATSTTISSGGLEVVSASGTTVNPAINGSGAVLDLLAGAVVSGGITFSGGGGELQIAGSAMPSSTISGFVSGDTFALASIAFDSLGHANLGPNNQLQITEGGTTYDLNLDPAQDFTGDQFQLTPDSGSGTLVSINTALSEPQSTLPVSIGDTATISTSFLFSSDRDYDAAHLNYTVLTAPVHGAILLNGAAAASFTQADIDNGLVQYRENGDVASGDGFTFQVADPAGNRVGPEGFKIAIVNTTTPVVEANITLPVATGGSAMIGGRLSTVALDDTPAQLSYTVLTAPAHGIILDNGAAAASFTQADIDDGLVQYHASGDGTSNDSFTFQVTDAAGDQTPLTTFNIDIRSRVPTAPAVDGTTTIAGASGNSITGGSGADLIIGLAGSQAIFGGSGSTTVLGAAFVGDNGTKGSDTVTGFSQSAGDRIFFPNQTAAGIDSVVASAKTSNGNTLITLPDGATMTLIGVTKLDSTFFS